MKKKSKASTKQSLESWAINLLLEHQVIRACPDHGHMRDSADPTALRKACAAARSEPPPGTKPNEAVAAIDEAMRWIGDTCPQCKDKE